MGRTLDSLKHNDVHRTPAPKEPATVSTPAQDCVVDWTLQEEVPFVEVGGPGKGVELSPLLVKHPPQARMQPPHPTLGKAFAGPKTTPVVNLTDAKPMTVAFEAWPRPATGGVAPEVIAHHQPNHPVAKEYAALLARMLPTAAASGQVLMLCGLHEHAGTSTVLLNLAVTAAQQKRQVVTLDANWARPGLAVRLGHDGCAGLREVCAGSLAVEQALRTTAVPNLQLIAAGAAGTALTTEALGWLLGWLRERRDLVLIDGPSVTDSAALTLLAPHAEALYLVLPQSETSAAPRSLAAAVARTGGRLRGLIHTHFEM